MVYKGVLEERNSSLLYYEVLFSTFKRRKEKWQVFCCDISAQLNREGIYIGMCLSYVRKQETQVSKRCAVERIRQNLDFLNIPCFMYLTLV